MIQRHRVAAELALTAPARRRKRDDRISQPVANLTARDTRRKECSIEKSEEPKMRDVARPDMHLGIAPASRRQAIAGLIALLAGATLPARAHAEVFTPPRGSELRADILDALRPTVADEIGGAIEFVVSSLRVQGNWAYASVRP
jgi:hypothetical protein